MGLRNGMSMVIRQSGSVVFHSEKQQVWRNSEGQHHRLGGPAVIRSDGTQKWYLNDQCHRVGGPALIHPNGNQYWYLKGKKSTQEEVER